MKITIKEPCHENWDNMAPNDKGAFCLSCKKNVVDFSKKTIDEVKTFFTELPSSENVCGRFKENQLNEMSLDHFLNEFMSWKFFKKAAVIFYLILGTTMLSGCSNSNDQVVGEMMVIPDTVKTEQCIKDTINNETTLLGEPSLIKGQAKIEEPPPVKEKDKVGDTRPKHLMGGPMVVRDTNVEVKHLKGNIKVDPNKSK